MRPIKVVLPLGILFKCTFGQFSTGNLTSTPSPMYPLSADGQFSSYLAELMAYASGGGSSSGEVLRAASRIEVGDFESFYAEFKFMADAVHEMALYASKNSSAKSAIRDNYFRSSQYYRAADFFLHGNWSDPRLTTLWDSQLADFESAISLLDIPGEKFTVQGPNFTIPGYFFPAKAKNGCAPERVPTILAGSGYDGAQEELYHALGVHVLERGWNFATYEGPGQQTVRRQQDIGFIPNWWDVVTPVVDHLSTLDNVDMSKLALVGVSFGGSLAPRAASKEHRFAAVLCVDGLYSMQQAILNGFPDKMLQAFQSGNATLFNEIIAATYQQAKTNIVTGTEFRWLLDQSLWSFVTTSPFEWLSELGNFSLDGIFPEVTCPVFIGDGLHDTLKVNNSVVAWEALGADKGYYWQFNTEYGAGEHCQVGAEPYLNMIIWDWLTGVFEGNWLKGNGTVAF